MSKLLFRVTKKDFRIDFFRAGGKGGQHQNKTSSACRISHAASGAVGESREERQQPMNRKIAFRRMANSRKFQFWARAQAAAIQQGYKNTEQQVEASMSSDNLRVEHIVTWTCDGDGCGKTETVTSLDPRTKPSWLALGELEDAEHLCARCAER